jgi:hypothetical protein
MLQIAQLVCCAAMHNGGHQYFNDAQRAQCHVASGVQNIVRCLMWHMADTSGSIRSFLLPICDALPSRAILQEGYDRAYVAVDISPHPVVHVCLRPAHGITLTYWSLPAENSCYVLTG